MLAQKMRQLPLLEPNQFDLRFPLIYNVVKFGKVRVCEGRSSFESTTRAQVSVTLRVCRLGACKRVRKSLICRNDGKIIDRRSNSGASKLEYNPRRDSESPPNSGRALQSSLGSASGPHST